MQGYRIPRPTWRSTSFMLCPSLNKPLRMFLAEKNLTIARLLNAFIIAVCKGDILVDSDDETSNRMNASVEDTVDTLVSVTLRDCNGVELKTANPKELELSII